MRWMTARNQWHRRYVVVLAMLTLACGATIATFNQRAYENATTLKAEALALVGKGTEPYANHKAAAERLMTRVEAAFEYAKGIPKNTITTQQWDILKARDRDLLGGFVAAWENSSPNGFGQAFVDAKKEQIGDAFDTIIDLESAKIRDD